MAIPEPNAGGNQLEVETLSPEEWRSIIDAAAKRYLGMSGEVFAEKWAIGWFAGQECEPNVARVAILLPFHRAG